MAVPGTHSDSTMGQTWKRPMGALSIRARRSSATTLFSLYNPLKTGACMSHIGMCTVAVRIAAGPIFWACVQVMLKTTGNLSTCTAQTEPFAPETVLLPARTRAPACWQAWT